MPTKPFSFRRAIDNDFNLTLAIIIPLIVWAIYILTLMFVGGSQVVFYLAVIITLLSPVALWLQLRKMQARYNAGEEVTGELHKVFFHQDRGRVDYSYTYQDQKFSNSVAIHKTKITEGFKVGQSIQLVVDREKPEHAFIVDLYT
jgi:hypothetical protein